MAFCSHVRPPFARTRCRLAAFAQKRCKPLQRQGVEHAFFRYTTLARNCDAPRHEIQLTNGMRVGIDAEHAAEFQCLAVPAPIELEPVRVAVDLDGHAVLRASLEDGLDIDVITGAAQELPSRGVAEDCRVRVRYRSDDALCLLTPVETKPAVDAGDDKVKAVQDLRRIVERSVGEDVGFDAFENAKAPAVAAVEFIRDRVLIFDLGKRKPARIVG